MKPMKRVFISDIHMGSEAAVDDSKKAKRPYGWLTKPEVAPLAAFLSSKTVQDADQLFLVGDLMDQWVCPVDVRPPTVDEIINAKQNQPIVKALRTFAAKPNKQLIYLSGNHDMHVDAKAAHDLCASTVFGPSYEEFPLRVSHGHQLCLFNSSDPVGRKYPLGYFITRCCATADRDGPAHKMGVNLWSIFTGATQVIKWIKDGKPFTSSVIDFVAQATGVNEKTPILMPDGSSTTLADVKAEYANLISEWNVHKHNHAATAVLCEWDPWNDIPIGTLRVNVMGHSHNRVFTASDNFGLYINLGTWCSGTPHFAVTTVDASDEHEMIVELCKWTGNKAAVDKREHFRTQ